MEYSAYIERPDVNLFGGGSASANRGVMLKGLHPCIMIQVYEVTDELARESSLPW